MKAFLALAVPIPLFAVLTFSQAATYCRDDRLILIGDIELELPRRKAGIADAQAHMRGMQQLEARQSYADFFALHEFTPTQQDELVRLIADHLVLTSHWSHGSVYYAPKAEELRRADELRSRIESLLGREQYAALVQYQDTLGERFYLRKLTNWLRVIDEPLTIGQKEQLVAIMVAERYRRDEALLPFKPGAPEYPQEWMSLLDRFDEHVLRLFDPILTPAQRDIARKHFANRSDGRQEALARYARARAEGDRSPFIYPAD